MFIKILRTADFTKGVSKNIIVPQFQTSTSSKIIPTQSEDAHERTMISKTVEVTKKPRKRRNSLLFELGFSSVLNQKTLPKKTSGFIVTQSEDSDETTGKPRKRRSNKRRNSLLFELGLSILNRSKSSPLKELELNEIPSTVSPTRSEDS